MRPVIPTLCVLFLAACEAPCDPDQAVCAGELQFGMAAFAANPAELGGLYSPQLAGCMVTRWSPEGEVQTVRQYDRLGRLVLDAVGLPQSGPQRELAWDAGCLVEDHVAFGDCTVETLRTCDDQGWPVEEQSTFFAADGIPGSTTRRAYDRSYDGHRLVGTTTWELDAAGQATQVDRSEVDWSDDRPVHQWFFGDEALEYEIAWIWRGDRLVEQVADSPYGPASADAWTYTGAELLEAHFEDGLQVRSWLRRPGEYWPYVEVDASGQHHRIEFACDTP